MINNPINPQPLPPRSEGLARRAVPGHGSFVPSALAATGIVLALGLSGSPWLGAGYGLFCYALGRMLVAPDRPLPIRWLILLIASLQWVVASHLAYIGVYTHSRYYMYVPEEVYMPIAVSGVLGLAIGTLTISNRFERRNQIRAIATIPLITRAAPVLPLLLIAVSLASSATRPFLPESLALVAYLGTQLKYSAAIMLVLSERGDRHWWVLGILGVAAIEAAATSLFHDVILWSLLVGSFYAFAMRVRVQTRVLAILIAMILGIAVQSVKPIYRAEYWGEENGGSGSTYLSLTAERLQTMLAGELTFSDAASETVLRLNQGWIISRVVQTVPHQQAYAGGETIIGALEAALLPRFLAPDKAIAGGRENFERFTALELGRGTSMGISTLGEAYANFGPIWGSAFMVLFGAGLATALTFVARLANRMPLLICFLPNIFLHSIKAETDFLSVINFLVKSGAFHIVLCFALTAIFGLKRFALTNVRPQKRFGERLG